MLYLRKEYFSLLGGTYNGSCILQGYVDEKRLKTPGLDSRVTTLIGNLKTNVHPFISYQQISQRVRGTLRGMARSLRMGYQALTAINNNVQQGTRLPVQQGNGVPVNAAGISPRMLFLLLNFVMVLRCLNH